MLVFSLTGFFAFGISRDSLRFQLTVNSKQLSIKQNLLNSPLLFGRGAGGEENKIFILQNDSASKALKRAANKQPRIATIMSAVLPGLGQIYNRKYWKPPVIYLAFAGVGYFFLKNNAQYQDYRHALLYRYDDNPNTIDKYPAYTDENLITLKAQYKKYRDLSAIGIGIVYLLNVVDANIDGHLKNFNKKINDDVTLRIKPYNTFTLNNKTQMYNGLTLQLNIK